MQNQNIESYLKYHQTANAVLMILPVDFIYNEQTAKDNEFMNKKEPHESS